MPEQLCRLLDFGKTSFGIELGEHGSEHFECRARATTPLVQARKSQGAAQLENHIQAGVGHYGVFSGKRWNNEIYPLLHDFVHLNS
nr:hypothetical protein [Bradyrhizobium agreste]